MYIRYSKEISKLDLTQIIFELENLWLKANIFYV